MAGGRWLLAVMAITCLPSALAASADARVEQTARQLLGEQALRAGLSKPLVEARVASQSGSPAACPQPTVEAVDTRNPGRLRFAVFCPGDDGGRQQFIVRAKVSAEVLVATGPLSFGRTLVAEDLTLERRDVANLRDAVSDPAGAVGLALKRSLRPGQALLRPMLVAPVLVHRGEAVRIVARRGAVEVSSAGEALENGQAGAAIRVRNTGTGKVIQARIVAGGVVEPVDFPINTMPQSPD